MIFGNTRFAMMRPVVAVRLQDLDAVANSHQPSDDVIDVERKQVVADALAAPAVVQVDLIQQLVALDQIGFHAGAFPLKKDKNLWGKARNESLQQLPKAGKSSCMQTRIVHDPARFE